MNEPAPHSSTQPRQHSIPAATAVIFRRAESGPPQILFVQRGDKMRFAAGAIVFPGGKVDAADRALAAELMPHEEQAIACARIAAIRETLEETGLVIAVREAVTPQAAAQARRQLLAEKALAPVLRSFNWTIDPDRLLLFAHWCPDWPGAFDTRFFVTDLGTGAVDIEIDATENTRLFWASAREVLAMVKRGDIRVIFPTHRNLERLAQFETFSDARAATERYPARLITPRRVDRDGETWVQIEDGHGYPVLGEPLAKVVRG